MTRSPQSRTANKPADDLATVRRRVRDFFLLLDLIEVDGNLTASQAQQVADCVRAAQLQPDDFTELDEHPERFVRPSSYWKLRQARNQHGELLFAALRQSAHPPA